MQNGRFFSKIALRLKKGCHKVSLCENCQRQGCRAFIGLTIHAKIIGVGRPLLPEILGQTDRIGVKSPFRQFEPIFSCSASTVTPTKKLQLTLTGSPLSAFQ